MECTVRAVIYLHSFLSDWFFSLYFPFFSFILTFFISFFFGVFYFLCFSDCFLLWGIFNKFFFHFFFFIIFPHFFILFNLWKFAELSTLKIYHYWFIFSFNIISFKLILFNLNFIWHKKHKNAINYYAQLNSFSNLNLSY